MFFKRRRTLGSFRYIFNFSPFAVCSTLPSGVPPSGGVSFNIALEPIIDEDPSVWSVQGFPISLCSGGASGAQVDVSNQIKSLEPPVQGKEWMDQIKFSQAERKYNFMKTSYSDLFHK